MTIKLFLGNFHIVFPLHYSKTQPCHKNIKTQQQQNKKNVYQKKTIQNDTWIFTYSMCKSMIVPT